MKQDINKVLLVSLHNYENPNIRVIHSIIEKYAQVKTVFFKSGKPIVRNMNIKPSEKEIGYLLKLINEFNPDLIGLSFISSYYVLAEELTKKIRNISKAKIMWGGIHSILMPEKCIKYADMVCISEGEIPIKNFFEKNSLDGFWVNKNGKVYKSEKRILTENLNELPLPNFKNQNKYYIEEDKIHNGDPITSIRTHLTMTSRGCPYNCTYCVNHVLKEIYHGQKLLRIRDVDNVIKELKAIKREAKGLRRILFIDELFALGNKEWMEEFAKRYKKEINLPFGLQYRPDMVKDGTLKILKYAGLDNMNIGLESGSEEFRKNVYNRYISDEQMLECQKILKKHNITGVYNLLVKNPLEKVEDYKKGFELLMKFQRPFSLHVYKLTHFPKTKLTERLLAENIKIDGYNAYENIYTFSPSKESEEDFWINMMGLTNKGFIPKKLLRVIAKKRYFVKHQLPVYLLVRVANFIKFLQEGFRWAAGEGFSYKIIISGFKNFKTYLKIYR